MSEDKTKKTEEAKVEELDDKELDKASGAGEWFVADSFAFGVEREMKESGEKGGTTDINIGVGELQEIKNLKRRG